jgi:hypothetical protein
LDDLQLRMVIRLGLLRTSAQPSVVLFSFPDLIMDYLLEFERAMFGYIDLVTIGVEDKAFVLD